MKILLKNKETIVCAAFCGSGKTYACNQINAVEIEFWKYKDNGLKQEYIKDIKKQIGKVDYIFISTEPEGLKLLQDNGIWFLLVYPENELREEYLNRYIERDSSCDFIGAFMKYWHTWINELKEEALCTHKVLKAGEYLQDVIIKAINMKWTQANKTSIEEDVTYIAKWKDEFANNGKFCNGRFYFDAEDYSSIDKSEFSRLYILEDNHGRPIELPEDKRSVASKD